MRPSGDQTGSPAPVEMFVNCFRLEPSALIVQICPPVTKAMRLPSGDQRGVLELEEPLVNCFGSPPATGTRYIRSVRAHRPDLSTRDEGDEASIRRPARRA